MNIYGLNANRKKKTEIKTVFYCYAYAGTSSLLREFISTHSLEEKEKRKGRALCVCVPESPPTSIFLRFFASRIQMVSFPAVGT